MIKAIDFQQVERFPYIFRRPFFARMCDAQQTSIPCCGEDPREFSGWVSYFRGIEPHANDSIEIRFRSEEHTSELQSLMRISYAVFCLKKKKHTKYKNR